MSREDDHNKNHNGSFLLLNTYCVTGPGLNTFNYHLFGFPLQLCEAKRMKGSITELTKLRLRKTQ